MRGIFCVDSTDYNTITATYNPDTSDTVNYRQVESEDEKADVLGSDQADPSDTFTTLLPKALYSCLKYKTDVDCQVLANLCTLKMYDPNSADCKALIEMSKS